LIALFVATTPASSATEQQLHRAGCTPCLQCLPAHDHLAGEPPQLPDRGARPAALRGCQGDGRVHGPSTRQTSREAAILLYAPALGPTAKRPRAARRPRRICRGRRLLWRHTHEEALEIGVKKHDDALKIFERYGIKAARRSACWATE